MYRRLGSGHMAENGWVRDARTSDDYHDRGQQSPSFSFGLIAYLFCQSYALCTQSENTSVRRASNDAQVTKFCLKRCIAVWRLRLWPPQGRYEVVERLVDVAQSGGMSKDDMCSQFRTALSSLMECTLVSIRFCFHWARFADK